MTFNAFIASLILFGITLYLPNPTHAKPLTSSQILKEQISVGGAAKISSINEEVVVEIQSSGEHWISFPLTAPETGYYTLTLNTSNNKLYDILIDGEKYSELTTNKIKWENNVLSVPLHLEKGQHSFIFYSNATNKNKVTWRSLEITKLPSVSSINIESINQLEVANNTTLLPIGKMFSGSYINVNIARESAIFTRGDYQYTSYFNPDGFLVVARKKLGSNYFEKYFVPIPTTKAPILPKEGVDFTLADPHNFISMEMDSKGYIHLAYGHHNSSIKYFRSENPYEINKWIQPKNRLGKDLNNNDATYVSFFMAKDKLFSMFRKGPHGYGEQVIVAYNDEKQEWQHIQVPFISDDGKASPYFWKPAISDNGTIHLFWTWRLSDYGDTSEDNPFLKSGFSGFTNTDIYYAQSKDLGKTWESSSGKKYQLPIKRNTEENKQVEVIVNIPVGEDFFNHFGAVTDKEGKPYIIYSRWQDTETQIPQQMLTFWNGSEWKTHKVTNYTQKIAWSGPQQDGRASTDVMRATLAVADDGTVLVISKAKENGSVVELYISDAKNYDIWSKRILFDGSVGGWEPQYDLDKWKQNKVLSIILSGVTDSTIKDSYQQINTLPLFERIMQKVRVQLNKVLAVFKIRIFDESVDRLNYYSSDTKVDILTVDKMFYQDKSYILEIPYKNIRD